MRVLAWKQGDLALPPEVEVAGLLSENAWNGHLAYEVQAVDLRKPEALEGGIAPFAYPLPLLGPWPGPAWGRGLRPEDNPEGLDYARKAGFRLLPEEAGLWLGLPQGRSWAGGWRWPWGGRRGPGFPPPVLHTPEARLKALVHRRLLFAYERRHPGLFSEALLAYWEVNRVQEPAGSP